MDNAIRTTRITGPPRPLRLRRAAVLRVMLRPRAAARLLEALAAEADMCRAAVGVVIRACALTHVPRRLRCFQPLRPASCPVTGGAEPSSGQPSSAV